VTRLARYALVGGFACVVAASAPASARDRHLGYVVHRGHLGRIGHVAHDGQFGGTVCSVFSRHPCALTVCSVFHRGPCFPEYPFPLGENLQLTIDSTQSHEGKPVESDHPVDTIAGMFAALRACWQPPADDEARSGMQMSVRFAFKRNGEIIGEPRVTYTTPGVGDETKQVYRHAIAEALARCTPLPFSDGMGGAVAGRPIAMRVVDNRQGHENRP
jgi:hypothetical protein